MMNRFLCVCILLMGVLGAFAQGSVKGKIKDKKTDEPLGFVNVAITQNGSDKIVNGAVTDVDGNFHIHGLANGQYVLTITFVGYKTLTRNFTISKEKKEQHYNVLFLTEDAHTLNEVTIVGQRSEMKLEVDRKSFNVDQQIANAGGAASDVLENIPSVEVDNDGNISLRGNSSVEVWINGKPSGLTSDNRAEILQQLPAESIERVEIIDNPSAKFSAEGSAGIINIVLKKDRKAGYYGSVQAGVTTRGGANTSFNINYNSKLFDAYLNVGYRHRHNEGGSKSRQLYPLTNTYQNYDGENERQGNNLFSRAGITLHASKKDDISLSGMFMYGGGNNSGTTPYHYGTVGAPQDSYMMFRHSMSRDRMNMLNTELNYRHEFTPTHFLDFNVSFNRWKSDNDNWYRDSTTYYQPPQETEYSYQYRPMHINNRSWEVKLDYENPITDNLKLQAGYNGRFSHENTPQESYIDDTWEGTSAQEDKAYYNRFIYALDIHALYATASYNFGKFGAMAGLRGEYWKVNTKSYDWDQEHQTQTPLPQQGGVGGGSPTPFKKDYFQLFPSVFLSYQITPTQQLQLNYTRRLRRPWGGQLNSFKNTRDATVISFGNPELTPEYSNSFSLNYLKTWKQHSLLVSAYYRPTSDVMQRITYQSSIDGLMYQTNFNVAKSTSTGLEMTAKNKFFRILDLTSNVNLYYYKLDGYDFTIDGQTIRGEGNHSFTWNARMMASLMLPYSISVQLTGRLQSRQVITQGYRKSGYSVDFGARKTFFNKMFTLSVNCRDLFNSRKWRNHTSSETFTRDQEFFRTGRTFRFTLTWNFGNMKSKKRQRPNGEEGEGEEDFNNSYDNNSGGGE